MTTYKFDLHKLLESMPPATRRNHERRMRVYGIHQRIYNAVKWPKLPVLNLIWIFWTCLMEEGIRNTIKPRWGALTFTYLNDAYKPTLYHTIRTLINPQKSATYVSGAPRNSKEWKHGRNKNG